MRSRSTEADRVVPAVAIDYIVRPMSDTIGLLYQDLEVVYQEIVLVPGPRGSRRSSVLREADVAYEGDVATCVLFDADYPTSRLEIGAGFGFTIGRPTIKRGTDLRDLPGLPLAFGGVPRASVDTARVPLGVRLQIFHELALRFEDDLASVLGIPQHVSDTDRTALRRSVKAIWGEAVLGSGTPDEADVWFRLEPLTKIGTAFVEVVKARQTDVEVLEGHSERRGSLEVVMTVNGTKVSAHVEPRMLLVHFLRERLRLTGTHVGCDTGYCGACTILVDGKAVKSCIMLAVQAEGATITTIEGLASNGQLHHVQEGFWERHGLQCGFCTPGMIITAVALLEENNNPTEAEIRHGIEGNLCRCTGYHNIVRAVEYAGAKMRGEEPSPPDWATDLPDAGH